VCGYCAEDARRVGSTTDALACVSCQRYFHLRCAAAVAAATGICFGVTHGAGCTLPACPGHTRGVAARRRQQQANNCWRAGCALDAAAATTRRCRECCLVGKKGRKAIKDAAAWVIAEWEESLERADGETFRSSVGPPSWRHGKKSRRQTSPPATPRARGPRRLRARPGTPRCARRNGRASAHPRIHNTI
jgi:hypothetical protein